MESRGSEYEAALRATGFEGHLSADHPLAAYSTWKIGGPAELLATPAHRDDLVRAVRWAAGTGRPWRILGNGSNLLVSDDGIQGLVIRVRRVLDDVLIEGVHLRTGAGASFPAVARQAAAAGLAGIEFGAGIPGTIGGAVVMNAGWHEFEIGNMVTEVEFMDPTGSIVAHDRDACAFGYRRSRFRGEPGIVLGATLVLTRGEPSAIRARLEHFASSRKQNQPTELPSCGSVFLKPDGDFAGRLIDAAGLKGARVGDIEVSTKHANFFVNHGRGTASDVLALVERVERVVEEKFGVRLVREFEYWAG